MSRVEGLPVEEIDQIDRADPPDDFSAVGWEWALSMCGGRDRVYGPDTPAGIGSYVAVVPRDRAEKAEAERAALRHALDGLRQAFGRFASHTPLCASLTSEGDCSCGHREALVLTSPGVPEAFALSEAAGLPTEGAK